MITPNPDWTALIEVCAAWQIKPETIIYSRDHQAAANRAVIARELHKTGISTARIAQLLNLCPRQLRRIIKPRCSTPVKI